MRLGAATSSQLARGERQGSQRREIPRRRGLVKGERLVADGSRERGSALNRTLGDEGCTPGLVMLQILSREDDGSGDGGRAILIPLSIPIQLIRVPPFAPGWDLILA